MVKRLKDEIRQQTPFRSLEEEAFLNLQRTANLQFQALHRFLKPFDITPTQYNALRILRGADPTRLTCKEVGARMVTPLPDVTRLLDRLETAELVERGTDPDDRRVVLVGISDAGMERLEAIDEPLDRWLREQLGHLSKSQLQSLIRLAEEGRSPA